MMKIDECKKGSKKRPLFRGLKNEQFSTTRAELGRNTTSVRSEARDARVLKQSCSATSTNLIVM
jgi:hypothetical protein